MESEKVKEIKKALECCTKEKCSSSCPLYYTEPMNCQDKLKIDVLTFLNELESENERLKNCIAELERKVYAKEDYYNAVKDRALEVFANKLKEKAIKLGWQGLGTTDIDETLQEVLKNG